ncbi:Fc.00g013000.m01.CDS01 [Cosmosporella sp. VM-42]
MAHHHLAAQQDSAAIFSPSVARIAASTARDWSYVDSWLRAKFHGRSVPNFERNPDTLKALLTLATLNDAADEERNLLAKTEAAALQELTDAEQAAQANDSQEAQSGSRPLRDGLLDVMEMNLSSEGHTALDALAQMSLQLGVAYPEPETLGRRMVDLQSSIYEVDQMKARVDILQRYIDDEASLMSGLLQQLQSDKYKAAPELAKQNLEMQRKVKAMAVKLPELHDQVAALAASIDSSHPTTNDIARDEQEFLSILSRKKELDLQMASFNGLPSNPDMARSELEARRGQLRSITSRRDAVFEGLVERESPVKKRR